MEKTVYFHIGAHKTGTTAIQQFLSMNRDNLRKRGFLYPGNHNAHHFIPHGLLNRTFLFSNPEEMMKNVFNEIHETKYANIIISAEGLESLKKNDISILKNKYLNDISVKIIFYVRRQDDLIESKYNGMVKGHQYQHKFSRFFFMSQNSQNIDFYSILEPWRLEFGQKNIIVRVYEKEQLPNGIFKDFLTAVGLEIGDCYKFPEEFINKSLNPDYIEYIRLCNSQFKEDTHIIRYLMHKFAMVDIGKNVEKHSLLSPQQRYEIMHKYKESNAKVAREYLGREDGRLFYASLPDLNEPWEPYEGLTVEKVVPIFTQLLYNMDVQNQTQFPRLRKNVEIKKEIWRKFNFSRNVLKRWKTNLFK